MNFGGLRESGSRKLGCGMETGFYIQKFDHANYCTVISNGTVFDGCRL